VKAIPNDGLPHEWCEACEGRGDFGTIAYYDIVKTCRTCEGRGWLPVLKKEKKETS
jgi:DnaJ-class molecular chaperone